MTSLASSRVLNYCLLILSKVVHISGFAWAAKTTGMSGLLLFVSLLNTTAAAERPNVLWITAEDMSPTLGCYGDSFATTPSIDRLATEGTRYTHAFATAPVCSPVRSCLINGVAATTQGTHSMRSLFPIPATMQGFPAFLRKAGYYTTNNVKTDYNTSSEPAIIAASWNESSDTAHWRNRNTDQPFFSVFNLMTSHQSRTMVWPYEQFQQEVQAELTDDQIHDPDRVPLPPYYPDTPRVRKTVARYYDCVTAMDAQVGQLLAELEADGLTENTIVFFYSDHGSGMPRHKRALFDSGMRVPLIIRFPKKYRTWAPTEPGMTTDRLVCFEDFGPTTLSLAGIESTPTTMRGKPFLGPRASEPHTWLFGHRDRVDEMLDMARSVRSKRFLYIRNFMPHLGYHQQSAWIDQGEVRQDFYALQQSGKGTTAQRQYLNPHRPIEELYDCQTDPLNLNNLAADARYRECLVAMRDQLQQRMIESRDLGLIPEIEQWRLTAGSTPMQWAASEAFNPKAILTAANLVGTNDRASILATLKAQDASQRYWAAVSCHSMTPLPPNLRRQLIERLADESVAVRIEAAAVLGKKETNRPAIETLIKLTQGNDLTVVLHAARMLEWIGDPESRPAIEALAERFADDPRDLAWFIRFTTSGFLTRVAN